MELYRATIYSRPPSNGPSVDFCNQEHGMLMKKGYIFFSIHTYIIYMYNVSLYLVALAGKERKRRGLWLRASVSLVISSWTVCCIMVRLGMTTIGTRFGESMNELLCGSVGEKIGDNIRLYIYMWTTFFK